MNSTVLTRRKALGLMVAVSVPPAAAVAASASKIGRLPPSDLQEWLDKADGQAVANYHAARLVDVMNELDPTRAYRSSVQIQHGFALICGDAIEVKP